MLDRIRVWFGAGVLAGLVVSGTLATHASGALATHCVSRAEEHYRVERIAVEAGKPSLPTEIPEAFAKLLDPAGVRVLVSASVEAKDAKPLCEIWLRRELPLAEKPAAASNVKLPRLAFGEFVGALRTTGEMTDYRDQAIAAGVYGLRYGQQPADGDHLGTSDSRDFLVLTSFEHDQDVAPVAKIDELVARSKPISPSEHAIVLYLAEAPPADATHGGSAPAAPAASSPAPAKDGAPPAGDANAGAAHDPLPRFFQRGSKDEWALELLLHGRPEGGKEPEPLRAAVVLVGHTAG